MATISMASAASEGEPPAPVGAPRPPLQPPSRLRLVPREGLRTRILDTRLWFGSTR
ncbi:photosystem I subunit E-2 [Actinidia rufa]|uniref:Photosystem I subunit E-2 n=1 Tax=Actinidia rufa TaxID=165716 RepID=A0A7J0H3R7_9ERIC|nr:photosystem I subunit E-2 [Actinidia rufa]